VEHLHINFGDPSCIGFWDIVRINRQTKTTVKTQLESWLI